MRQSAAAPHQIGEFRGYQRRPILVGVHGELGVAAASIRRLSIPRTSVRSGRGRPGDFEAGHEPGHEAVPLRAVNPRAALRGARQDAPQNLNRVFADCAGELDQHHQLSVGARGLRGRLVSLRLPPAATVGLEGFRNLDRPAGLRARLTPAARGTQLRVSLTRRLRSLARGAQPVHVASPLGTRIAGWRGDFSAHVHFCRQSAHGRAKSL